MGYSWCGPVALRIVAGPDYDTEIKQLRATMSTIGQVLDLDGMRREIADLGEQVAAPDLWDDQANATRVTGRLSALQGEVDRFTELESRIEDLGALVELGDELDDAASLAEAEVELPQGQEGRRGARGPHPAVGRVRRPRGPDHHPLRRRWRRRRGLRRDADADVRALGRAAQVPRRGLRDLLRRGGGPQVGHLRHPRAVRLRHPLGRGRHPPPGADQPVRQPGPPPDVVRGGRGRAGARADRRDRHPRRGHPRRRLPFSAAPAGSRSTPPTPRSA